MAVHITIGNSDDGLRQADWATFVEAVEQLVDTTGWYRYGTWFSAPDSRYQNACWAFEPPVDGDIGAFRQTLQAIAYDFSQDSIAWNESETRFVESRGEGW